MTMTTMASLTSSSSSSQFTPPSYPQQSKEDALHEISQRLMVMREQEATNYKVSDYLAAEWQAKLREATSCIGADEISGGVQGQQGVQGGDAQVSPTNAAAANGPGSATNSTGSASDGSAAAADGSSSASSASTSSQINEVWREKICEWCYQVVDHFDFHREVVSVAMSYLDRYLATRTVNRRIFQLAAMTALYLAIKLFEPGRLRMSALIDLSRGYFMAEHIVTMEDSMLQSLEWHVHPPTPFAFCRDLMRLVSTELGARVRHDVNELARFMTELSVCDYWFARRKPSNVALASLINAMDLQGPRRVDPHYKYDFLQRARAIGMDITQEEEIMECYERLREMYNAGGYNPNLDEHGEEEGIDSEGEQEEHRGEVEVRVETISPQGVADGPDAVDSDLESEDDEELSQMEMECA